jgi:hypothetical protein
MCTIFFVAVMLSYFITSYNADIYEKITISSKLIISKIMFVIFIRNIYLYKLYIFLTKN